MRHLPWTEDETCVPCIGRWIFNHWTTRQIQSFIFFPVSRGREISKSFRFIVLLSFAWASVFSPAPPILGDRLKHRVSTKAAPRRPRPSPKCNPENSPPPNNNCRILKVYTFIPSSPLFLPICLAAVFLCFYAADSVLWAILKTHMSQSLPSRNLPDSWELTPKK